MKPWQRKLFKRDKLTNEIQILMERYIEEGYAKTEDEAYSMAKKRYRLAERIDERTYSFPIPKNL